MSTDNIVICALYRFVRLDDYAALRQPLIDQLLSNDIKGTLLLAREGINGTIAGTQQGIDAILNWLQDDPRFKKLSYKFSYDSTQPFYRTKVKLKKEIVTMGVENIDPNKVVGTYVKPKDWNRLIQDPEVLLIDTRNAYEIDIGTFKNAVNPNTETFREFPRYVERHLDKQRHKKVAMFCTGGIRCEKSTAFLKEQGFAEVFHLEGGILKYLEEVPAEESLWEGECFVFDNRVAVTHNLDKGSYDQCYACRHPISEEDKQRPEYEQGVSCHLCYDSKTDEQRQRFADREKQMTLARQRGEHHLGIDTRDMYERRRKKKLATKNCQRQQDKQAANKHASKQ